MVVPTGEREKIPNIAVTLTSQQEINLFELLNYIKTLGFPIDGNMISYYSATSEMFVYCGNDPIPKRTFVPVVDLENHRQLKIRCRQVNKSVYEHIMDTDKKIDSEVLRSEADSSPEHKAKAGSSKKQVKNNCRRTKERKIGQIIEKVGLWRKLYYGVPDSNGQIVRLSLEEAAQKVGISKKSLDDYLLQIRFGRKFGFNFNEHIHDKVGVLRAFVKKNKSMRKSGGEIDTYMSGVANNYGSYGANANSKLGLPGPDQLNE